MANQDPKSLYRDFVEVVWHQKDLTAAAQFFAVDFIDHNAPPIQGPGYAGLEPIFALFLNAFPDSEVNIERMVQDGEWLLARVRFTGTHDGEFFGIAPTGKRIVTTESHLMRYRDGVMMEHYYNGDDFGMMQQIGVIPS